MRLALPAAPGSFRRQMVVLTSCITALAMLLLTIVLQVILADLSRRSVDRVLTDRADAVADSVVAATPGDRLETSTTELDTGVVVYDATGRPAGGVGAAGLEDTYRTLGAAGSTQQQTVDGTRLRAQPFATPGGTSGVVVVSERLEPYRAAEGYALIVSLVTGLLATAAAAAIAAWVTSRALEPVAALSRTAAEWSEHDLGRRFDLGAPTNEITALAATLDTLLDKVSAAIRSEQRLTSELAHELRTPLTAVQGTADLALLGEDLAPDVRETLEEVAAAARRMATTITTLLEVARTEAGTRDAASSSLSEVVDEVLRTVAHHRVELVVSVADQRVAAPPSVVARALTPVVENAVRFARSRVVVSSSTTDAGGVRVVVEDDGPGVDDRTDRVFLPGTTSSGGSGAGLGLAIARRMARSVGGEVDLTRAGGPTRFELRLPRA